MRGVKELNIHNTRVISTITLMIYLICVRAYFEYLFFIYTLLYVYTRRYIFKYYYNELYLVILARGHDISYLSSKSVIPKKCQAYLPDKNVHRYTA